MFYYLRGNFIARKKNKVYSVLFPFLYPPLKIQYFFRTSEFWLQCWFHRIKFKQEQYEKIRNSLTNKAGWLGQGNAVGGAKIAKIHQKFDPYRHQMSQS